MCPPYVWMPPVHTQHKESILCETKGCLYAPICLNAPCMFGYPHMFGYPTVCLDALHMFGCCQMYGGIQRYERHPNIWGMSKHTGASKHIGASKCMGCIWTPPQSDKACFLCVVYVQLASKHLPDIHGGIQTYGSVHTYSGGIQT